MVNKVPKGKTSQVQDSKQDELRDSVKWLRLAVGKIQSLAIPASPENYSIWYEYFSGRKPDLKQAMDFRLAKKLPFTPQIYRELYATYFGDGPEQQLAEIRRAIRSLISRLSSEISNLNEGMDSFSGVLSDCETLLESDPEVSALGEMIQNLLSETRQCRSKNHSTLAKVALLNKEIDTLKDSLQHMSEEVFEDALTGVANRRGFNIEIATAFEAYQSEQTPASLLLLDIDYFKKVNDDYGHLVGDRVLRFVAETIKRSVKGSDYVARYGGEEFAVIFPATNLVGALTASRQVLASVSGKKLTVSKGGKSIGSVTLSGGLAELKINDTLESIVERADKALYRAKSAGRNSIVTDEDESKSHIA